MSLYDRKIGYDNQSFGAEAGADFAQDFALINFVKQTYSLFAASLLAGAVGAFVGVSQLGAVVAQNYILFVIAEFALLFGLFFVREKPGINLAVLFGFTFVSGLTLAPILGRTLALAYGAETIAYAFLLTTAIFGIMSIFALRTRSDLANMGKMLFIALIVVVVGSLINLFLGNPLLQTLIAGAGAIIFSLYIAYDTQNIVRGRYDNAVMAAVGLYINFLNLFISLLQILGIFNNRE